MSDQIPILTQLQLDGRSKTRLESLGLDLRTVDSRFPFIEVQSPDKRTVLNREQVHVLLEITESVDPTENYDGFIQEIKAHNEENYHEFLEEFDLNTGQWLSIEDLSKKEINKKPDVETIAAGILSPVIAYGTYITKADLVIDMAVMYDIAAKIHSTSCIVEKGMNRMMRTWGKVQTPGALPERNPSLLYGAYRNLIYTTKPAINELSNLYKSLERKIRKITDPELQRLPLSLVAAMNGVHRRTLTTLENSPDGQFMTGFFDSMSKLVNVAKKKKLDVNKLLRAFEAVNNTLLGTMSGLNGGSDGLSFDLTFPSDMLKKGDFREILSYNFKLIDDVMRQWSWTKGSEFLEMIKQDILEMFEKQS